MQTFFLIILLFHVTLMIHAKDYTFEVYGISQTSTINISDNSKFSSYTSEGMWTDSNGDYGNEKCSGYVKQFENNVELEIYCETVNQNDEKFLNSRIRKSNKGGGVGLMRIISGTGKYKKLIGLECPYGVNYKKKYAWLKAQCIGSKN